MRENQNTKEGIAMLETAAISNEESLFGCKVRVVTAPENSGEGAMGIDCLFKGIDRMARILIVETIPDKYCGRLLKFIPLEWVEEFSIKLEEDKEQDENQ